MKGFDFVDAVLEEGEMPTIPSWVTSSSFQLRDTARAEFQHYQDEKERNGIHISRIEEDFEAFPLMGVLQRIVENCLHRNPLERFLLLFIYCLSKHE